MLIVCSLFASFNKILLRVLSPIDILLVMYGLTSWLLLFFVFYLNLNFL